MRERTRCARGKCWAWPQRLCFPVVGSLLGRFWAWYQRHYLVTLVLATAAFCLQVFHLYWLFTDVVLQKATGRSYFALPGIGVLAYVPADYLEVPALVSAPVLDVHELRRRGVISVRSAAAQASCTSGALSWRSPST